jgi:cbb3-type cytochrome oxidase subunit 3
MKLSDIVANSGLEVYAEIALIGFFVAFILIVVRTMRRTDTRDAARLPLDDEPRRDDGDRS